MNKKALIKAIAAKADIDEATAKRVIEAFIDTVNASLARGDEVRLVGFGTFKVVPRAASVGRNPRTGEVTARPAGRRAVFRAGDQLRTALGGPHGGGTGADD